MLVRLSCSSSWLGGDSWGGSDQVAVQVLAQVGVLCVCVCGGDDVAESMLAQMGVLRG